MRYRQALDPEIFVQILFAVKRGAIGCLVFFVLDAMLFVVVLGPPLHKILAPQTLDWLGDGSLRIAPILGALVGVCLYNDRLQARFLLTGVGLGLGMVAGVVLGRSLTEGNVERHARFLLMVVTIGTLMGGGLGHLVFTMNDPDRVLEPDDEDEPDPGRSPLFDREMDG